MKLGIQKKNNVKNQSFKGKLINFFMGLPSHHRHITSNSHVI